MDVRKSNGQDELARVEKATFILPLKKRQLRTPIETDESGETSLTNINHAVIENMSDSDSEIQKDCDCCVESGYLADGEQEELPYRYYTQYDVIQEPRPRKRHHAAEKIKA